MLHGAGIFTYIYLKNDPNVGKYYIHGASGMGKLLIYFDDFYRSYCLNGDVP